MNRPYLLLSVILLFSSLQNYGQADNPNSRFPEIRILISKSQYSTLLQGKGQKLVLKKPVLIINHDTTVVREVHSRGNNSLTFDHKSLSVDLENSFTVRNGGANVKIKKFNLLNLVMDKNLWHNRWAFLTMSEISIFPLYQTFCTLWINDQPQGIYLLVEKPHYYSDIKAKSPYMIRRGLNHTIDTEYIDAPSKEKSKKYRKQYRSLYEDISRYKNEELYKRLNTGLVLDHYFVWLAFNYLIMNGDYADEVYLYILPESGQFDVIPWDYDDIFKPNPHEGLQSRNAVASLKNKLIFSGEDPLDRAIASDPFVYQHYLGSFKKLLLALTPESLTRLSDQVKDELLLLSDDQPASNASRFLGKEPFQIINATEDMRLALDFVIKRRNALLKEME